MITEIKDKVEEFRLAETQKVINNVNKLFAEQNKTKKAFKDKMAGRYSDVYLNKVFSGSRDLTDEILDAFCDFLNVDRETLLEGI